MWVVYKARDTAAMPLAFSKQITYAVATFMPRSSIYADVVRYSTPSHVKMADMAVRVHLVN